MVSSHAIFLICPTTAALGVAAAQEAVSPAAQQSTQSKLAKPKKAKAKGATAVKSPFPREPIPFQNDLPAPDNKNRGGSVGLKFPF
jgi:hypothetical protein